MLRVAANILNKQQRSCDISVSKETGYKLNGWSSFFNIGNWDCYLHYHVQNGSEDYPLFMLWVLEAISPCHFSILINSLTKLS